MSAGGYLQAVAAVHRVLGNRISRIYWSAMCCCAFGINSGGNGANGMSRSIREECGHASRNRKGTRKEAGVLWRDVATEGILTSRLTCCGYNFKSQSIVVSSVDLALAALDMRSEVCRLRVDDLINQS